MQGSKNFYKYNTKHCFQVAEQLFDNPYVQSVFQQFSMELDNPNEIILINIQSKIYEILHSNHLNENEIRELFLCVPIIKTILAGDGVRYVSLSQYYSESAPRNVILRYVQRWEGL